MSMSESRRRRFVPHPWLSLVLASVWLLAEGTLAPGHVIVAVVLGLAIPLLTRGLWPDAPRLRRPAVAARLLAVFLYDLVLANFMVARLVLGPNARLRSSFVRVPLDLEDELGIAVLAGMVTLTPGTVSSRVSADRRVLLVHGLDVADPEQAAARIKQRYEAPLRKVLGC